MHLTSTSMIPTRCLGAEPPVAPRCDGQRWRPRSAPAAAGRGFGSWVAGVVAGLARVGGLPAVVLLVLLRPAFSQEEGAANDELLRRLDVLDAKIYSPPPIDALTFLYRPGSEAIPEPPYRIRYFWKKGVGERTEFVDNQGIVVEKLPGFTEERQQSELAKHFRASSKELGEIVRGMTFRERYAEFRGRLVTRTVNGAPEDALVLDARAPKRVRRVVLSLGRDGLPWKSEKELVNGDTVVQQFSYEPHGEGRFLLTKVQHFHTPAQVGQRGFSLAYVFEYQLVGGVLVVSTIRKTSRDLPKEAVGTTALVDLRLNAEVPEFVPES